MMPPPPMHKPKNAARVALLALPPRGDSCRDPLCGRPVTLNYLGVLLCEVHWKKYCDLTNP